MVVPLEGAPHLWAYDNLGPRRGWPGVRLRRPKLQAELLALFGVAKESGAVVEVDGYESPPARSPARSPVNREAPANFPSQSRTKTAGSIQPFRASQQAAAHSRDAFYER